MPRYTDLKKYRRTLTEKDDPTKEPYPDKDKWIAERLLALRHDLRQQITAKRKSDSLIVASWNLVAFDGGRPRLDESFHYLAEIISCFDICALQEIKPDLGPLNRLVWLLGPNWDYFVTDAGHHEGANSERMAFVFNKDKVFFRKLIGEIVFPQPALQDGDQLVRTPFFAAFQAGWFKFVMVTTHIVFEGKEGQDALVRRAREIRAISEEVVDRSKREEEVYILLGDFNIPSQQDQVMAALTEPGLMVPNFPPSNLGGDKSYDQIAFGIPPELQGVGIKRLKSEILRHNAFDWRNAVFGPPAEEANFNEDPEDIRRITLEESLAHYEPIAAWNTADNPKNESKGKPYKNFKSSYTTFMKHEMSDHLPIWAEITTDYSEDYLKRFK